MFSPVYLISEKLSRVPVSLRVTSEGFIVTHNDRQQVFGQAVLMREVHHISTIKEAQVGEEGKERFTIRLLSAQQGLHFSAPDPWPTVKLVNQMLSRWQIQQPVSSLCLPSPPPQVGWAQGVCDCSLTLCSLGTYLSASSGPVTSQAPSSTLLCTMWAPRTPCCGWQRTTCSVP